MSAACRINFLLREEYSLRVVTTDLAYGIFSHSSLYLYWNYGRCCVGTSFEDEKALNGSDGILDDEPREVLSKIKPLDDVLAYSSLTTQNRDFFTVQR
jgi:hypothetical protein